MSAPLLELDFKRRWHSSRFGALLLVVGVTGAALALAEYHTINEELERQMQNLDGAERPAKAKHATQLPASDPKHFNQVLDRLTLPWEQFFDALETNSGDQATLLAIVPDVTKGTVQIRGEARNIDVVLQYVSKLESSGFFHHAELVEHELGMKNAELPLRFLVTARWHGLAADGEKR